MERSIHLGKEAWLKYFHGWEIVDCAIRENRETKVVYFCVRKLPRNEQADVWDTQIPTRFFALNIAERDRYSLSTSTGFDRPRIGVTLLPEPRGILVSRDDDGNALVSGKGVSDAQEQIAPNKNPMTTRIKCINGYAYSVGWYRTIYKRIDEGKWERFGDLPHGKHIEQVGFEDIDAFSDNEMYAVGGHGDVWMYDGRGWGAIDFPSTEQLSVVVCAGDGSVYVGGEGLWRGKKEGGKLSWERFGGGGGWATLWNDAVWFEDKLWLSSDTKFMVWDGKSLERVTGEGAQIFGGHLDARDGLLLAANDTKAMVYDGKEWRTLIASYELTAEEISEYNERERAEEGEQKNEIEFDRGLYAASNDEYEEAIEHFTREIESGRRNKAEVYYERGQSHYKLGDSARAIEDCTRAIELSSNFDLAYITRNNTHAYRVQMRSPLRCSRPPKALI
ncbi:hypothetical protein AGMMS50230_18040 [Spirochaetia bacterium]|nr:hypothetical protein AGMMS50230_18040 [Spirochaetia bacterium]